MKAKLPPDILLALAQADRAPGWNNRNASVRRFDLDGCALIVVPARVWAYRRRQQRQDETNQLVRA